VHDRFCPDFDGNPALPPTYMYIDAYLGTIARLRAMGLERIYSAHWPDRVTAEEVRAWLDLSKDFAEGAERTILGLVRDAKGGATLHELLGRIKPTLGAWPANRDSAARFFVAGHLEHLEQVGLIKSQGEPPVKFFAT
jgi:hypothetical protein